MLKPASDKAVTSPPAWPRALLWFPSEPPAHDNSSRTTTVRCYFTPLLSLLPEVSLTQKIRKPPVILHCKLVSAFFFSSSKHISPLLLCPVVRVLTLNLSGRERSSLTLMERPMRVAMLQCGMVGVNSTDTVLSASFTCGNTTTRRWHPSLPGAKFDSLILTFFSTTFRHYYKYISILAKSN